MSGFYRKCFLRPYSAPYSLYRPYNRSQHHRLNPPFFETPCTLYIAIRVNLNKIITPIALTQASLLESDQTQLMVKVPASSYFIMPTPHKVCLVWFHFRLTAG